MSTVIERRPKTSSPSLLPSLNNGDHMTQVEFHRRYLAYPKHVKIELIGGIVYMASPVSRAHGLYQEELNFPLGMYRRATPGVELVSDTTMILGKESEPRPDLTLRLLHEFGGRSWPKDKYVEGSPEWLGEVASSSRAIDLHEKKMEYRRAGILEYLVLCVEEQELHWFHFESGELIKPNRQGIYRSRVFPGLWIHGSALLARESARNTDVLQQGLASREHAAFVNRLNAAFRKHEQEERK